MKFKRWGSAHKKRFEHLIRLTSLEDEFGLDLNPCRQKTKCSILSPCCKRPSKALTIVLFLKGQVQPQLHPSSSKVKFSLDYNPPVKRQAYPWLHPSLRKDEVQPWFHPWSLKHEFGPNLGPDGQKTSSGLASALVLERRNLVLIDQNQILQETHPLSYKALIAMISSIHSSETRWSWCHDS